MNIGKIYFSLLRRTISCYEVFTICIPFVEFKYGLFQFFIFYILFLSLKSLPLLVSVVKVLMERLSYHSLQSFHLLPKWLPDQVLNLLGGGFPLLPSFLWEATREGNICMLYKFFICY